MIDKLFAMLGYIPKEHANLCWADYNQLAQTNQEMLNTLVEQEQEIDGLEQEIVANLNRIALLNATIQELALLKDAEPKSETELYYENKYPKRDYAPHGALPHPKFPGTNIPVDVRTFAQFENDPKVKNIATGGYNLNTGTDDEKAAKICAWVQDHFTYRHDSTQTGYGEYWFLPQISIDLKKGDCEDGAILMKNIMLAAGIPDWKARLTFADVQYNGATAGHVFVNYYSEEQDKWVILDWCIVDNSYTKINTPTGGKRISELKINDVVLGYNEKTGAIEETIIKKIGKRNAENIFTINYLSTTGKEKKILCTGEHPWLVNGKWKQTSELRDGDEIYWANPKSLTNMFNPKREQQYKRTSKRQTENNVFTQTDVRKKLSANNAMKRPEIVEKNYSNRAKSDYRSVPETLLQKFFEDHSLPVSFVGDSSYWVVGKNPDFLVEGTNKVIEVTTYGYLDRDEKWAKEMVKHFEKHNHEVFVAFYDKRNNKMFNEKELVAFVLNGLKVISVKQTLQSKQWSGGREVWNMHCEPHNNYFVNGLLCHNCYYPNKDSIANRMEYKNDTRYGKVYYSWNREFVWEDDEGD